MLRNGFHRRLLGLLGVAALPLAGCAAFVDFDDYELDTTSTSGGAGGVHVVGEFAGAIAAGDGPVKLRGRFAWHGAVKGEDGTHRVTLEGSFGGDAP